TDFPERFTIGNTIYLIKSDEETVPVEIENYRQMNKYGLLKLKGYDDIKHSELLKGLELKIKKEQVDKLPEGEYYYVDIIGCEVYTITGELIGVLDLIIYTRANDVWVFKNIQNNEHLIQFIPPEIKSVVIENKSIEIESMEGVLV